MSSPWIDIVADEDATGRLRTIYDRIRSPAGQIDRVMSIHSLRPHSLEGHMALYKNVLHHSANTLPKWYLEAIGVFVSLLNGCAYCAEHHFAGMRELLKDDSRAVEIRAAFEQRSPENAFHTAQLAGLRYAQALTLAPAQMSEALIADMRVEGLDDGQILEINQVTAYFAYANRTVLGLGVTHEGEQLGLAPSDTGDPDNWGHQ